MTQQTLDATSFLAAEAEGFEPYLGLLALSDDVLTRPVEGAHGWSGRDLMAHLAGWHEETLAVIAELHFGASPSMDRYMALDGDGEAAVNAAMLDRWSKLSAAELRDRFVAIHEAFRAALAALPEERWLTDERAYQWMDWNTMDHYRGHAPDLRAILTAAR